MIHESLFAFAGTVLVAVVTTLGVIYKSKRDTEVAEHKNKNDAVIEIIKEYRVLNDVYRQRWEEATARIELLQKEIDEIKERFEREIEKRDRYIEKLVRWGHEVVRIVSSHGIEIPQIPDDVDLS